MGNISLFMVTWTMNIKKKTQNLNNFTTKRGYYLKRLFIILYIYTCTRGVRTHRRAARTVRIKRQQYTIIACNHNNIIVRTLNEIEFDVFDSDIGFFFTVFYTNVLRIFTWMRRGFAVKRIFWNIYKKHGRNAHRVIR